MATTNLPSVKKFYKEDFPVEVQSWIEKLIIPMNDFMRVVYEKLNKNISLDQNIMSFTYDIQLPAAQTYPVYIPNTLPVNPIGVSIIYVLNTTDAATVTNAVTCHWIYDGSSNRVQVNNITGLEAAHAYTIKIIVWGS